MYIQNETLVTGGEDGKLNVWPIKPIPMDDTTEEDEDEEDSEEDESMVVDSPKPRKRERLNDDERVRIQPNFQFPIFDINLYF